MSARILLFGASGYTGERTAAAMVARGLRPVLTGRDPARLAVVAERLGGLESAYADVADRTSLIELVKPDDVLVSTVGPFHKMGWAAVRTAVDAGATYLDSTGEPPFIRSVYEWWGPEAEETGAALLTAFGHDYVPGVLAGALALRGAGAAATRVDVGYFLTGRGRLFSRGTLHSLFGIALEDGYALREGRLAPSPNGARLRTFDVDGRPRPGVSIGASEQFALPRLAPQLNTVEVYLGWFGSASGVVHATSEWTSRVGHIRGTRWAAKIGADLATRRVPAAPSAAALASATVHVVAEAFDATGTLLARIRLRAPEAYALTAGLLAWGAGRAAEHGVDGVGALDAVSAFGLDEVVKGATDAGVVIEEWPSAAEEGVVTR
jgi:short subunit dehydrogenase-like uncharacterized protein